MKRLEKKKIFIAESADVIGDVILGEYTGVWYHATIRGDQDQITIGKGTNVQDNCVIHTDAGFPVSIGEYVTIGHGAILHGCRVGKNTVIGMGAILLNGCEIGKNCIVAAGTLITQNQKIPDGTVVMGNPGRIKRNVHPEEIEGNRRSAELYMKEAENHLL